MIDLNIIGFEKEVSFSPLLFIFLSHRSFFSSQTVTSVRNFKKVLFVTKKAILSYDINAKFIRVKLGW